MGQLMYAFEEDRSSAALERLRTMVAEPVRDEQDLLAWLPKAGLLAAVPGGDRQALDSWEQRVGDAQCTDLSELVYRRLLELNWDCQNADGEDLADAVLDAQEWGLWARLSGVTGSTSTMVEAMEEAVRHARDDEAYRDAIEDWRITWQIDESMLIPPVRCPMTATECEFAHRLLALDRSLRRNEDATSRSLTDPPVLARIGDFRDKMKQAAADAGYRPRMRLKFLSPDRAYFALMVIGEEADKADLTFWEDATGTEAFDLAGSIVTLGPGPVHTLKISHDAEAVMSLQDLPSHVRAIVVGSRVWLLQNVEM